MLKKDKKAREEEANLTFRPHVNRVGSRTHSSAPSTTSKDLGNRFDALYSDALKRHLETKWKETSDEKDLTFTPKITARGGRSRSGSAANSRVQSRASSREREATVPESTIERLHSTPKGKLKHGVDPDNKLTFRPEITKRAMSIDRKESAKRLYESNSLDKEKARRAKEVSLAKERELENCTFSPKLNQTTKYDAKEKLDLKERMARFEEMKRKRIEDAQKQKIEEELAAAPFKPAFQAKLKRAPTPTKPFPERLSQPFERHVPSEVVAELNASMTFKPTLVSKRSASVIPMPILVLLIFVLCAAD
jgi:hypothetical protein